MEVLEGEMAGQLRAAEELVSTQTTFLLRHLNDLGALTAGIRQSKRVAILGKVKLECQCVVTTGFLPPRPRLQRQPDLSHQPGDPR